LINNNRSGGDHPITNSEVVAMSELDEVFETLKREDICTTQYAFSRDFLGRAPSYFAILKSNKVAPSTHVLMVLHLKLCELVKHAEEPKDMSSYQKKQSLITLSNKVLSEIKTKCKK